MSLSGHIVAKRRKMFTTNHFIWIGICVAMIGILLYCSLKFKFSFKTSALIMSGISACSELLKIFTHIEEAKSEGGVLDPTALPLHLCSILIFVIFYITFTKNEKMRERMVSFVVPIAIVGGTLAILIATSGVNFARPYAYQCFIYHAGLIWWALYLICTKQVKLGIDAYKSNLIILGSLLFIMIWVNSILSVYDTNFFFIVRPPADNLPLLNLNNGWLVYLITLVLLGVTLLTLVHIGPIIKEIKARKSLK